MTSRVIVNRVWMHHFGEPLVSTPSDFGTRSTPPSHPELLDYLAARLMDEGWSLKALHRLIVLSRDVPAVELRPARLPQGRPGEPADLALSPAPARPRGDARHAALRRRAAGRPDGRPAGGRGRRPRQPAADRLRHGGSPEPADDVPRLRLRQPRPVGRTSAPDHRAPAGALQHERPVRHRAGQGPRRPARATPGPRSRRGSRRSTGSSLAGLPPPAEAAAAARFIATRPAPAIPDRSGLSRWEQLAQVLLMTNEFLFVD